MAIPEPVHATVEGCMMVATRGDAVVIVGPCGILGAQQKTAPGANRGLTATTVKES